LDWLLIGKKLHSQIKQIDDGFFLASLAKRLNDNAGQGAKEKWIAD